MELLTKNGIEIMDSGDCGTIEGEVCRYYSIPGEKAIEAWELVRAKDKDYHPVILPCEFNEGQVISDDRKEIQKDLAKYSKMNLKSWFVKSWGDYDFDDEYDEMKELMEEMGEEVIPNKEPEPSHTFSIPYEVLSKKPHKSMWLVTVPRNKLLEFPIYIQYGGWNACPYPAVHAAIMKRWKERYQAELFGMTGDIVEMKVHKPPQDYKQAFIIAKEQMAYCDDIVFQGTMTVERLAKTLIDSTSWYFWWD